MVEPKSPLDDALKDISDKLNKHAAAIKQIQDNVQRQINTLRDNANRQWSQVTTELQELSTGLSDMKQLLQTRSTNPPSLPPRITFTPQLIPFSFLPPEQSSKQA
ncbi:unnamed protein product [Rotaria magnacalcarata]|uniref:Uncharacterized protein n=1 Tax=Rotaria magnacalcarata TaxID=392030 RepID=A0A815CYK5_9BILA|nr:unnamed protein product [Rotaria magnacalcarata]CAF2117993.1 unnamed protein product [Rotaria magnacalcarata]CAF3901651.1 unnamed protein product [Rotaria magnacalcarata]CAF4166154.1 unnamed protein product [Rotaria magnacalcarata]